MMLIVVRAKLIYITVLLQTLYSLEKKCCKFRKAIQIESRAACNLPFGWCFHYFIA